MTKITLDVPEGVLQFLRDRHVFKETVQEYLEWEIRDHAGSLLDCVEDYAMIPAIVEKYGLQKVWKERNAKPTGRLKQSRKDR